MMQKRSSEAEQEAAMAAGRVKQQQQPDGDGEDSASTCKIAEKSGGFYSDQQNIDAECDKLLWNAKKQVKQMMEEAVTRKFIGEDSSIILSLCVAVDACLSHGLKRRALGLFKTSSSTALVQKVSKNCKSAQEVLETVEQEDKKTLSEQKQQQQKNPSAGSNQQRQENSNTNGNGAITSQKSPVNSNLNQNHQVANYANVHKRNKWIKVALIDKKLVSIVDHLAENALKYYEPDALMANCLCAQILSSLLVGPSALEFSRSKSSDYHYQFDDPSADELLKRHKLANPIACLCNKQQQLPQPPQPPANNNYPHPLNDINHSKLSRSATVSSHHKDAHWRPQCRQSNSYNVSQSAGSNTTKSDPSKRHASDDLTLSSGSQKLHQQQVVDAPRRSPSPNRIQLVRSDSRRRPLALKTNSRRGTLVTDCHHYSCQEISEHQQTKGYSFLCSSTVTNDHHHPPGKTMQTPLAITSGHAAGGGSSGDCGQLNAQQQQQHHLHHEWSPRMLHETLHQNSKSKLLYAKNNVLLENQPNETMAGYLSLHQTSTDLILKWIPNQMINGGSQQQVMACTHQGNSSPPETHAGSTTPPRATTLSTAAPVAGEQPVAVESSYLDLVVSLSVSRIVLLHCQFGKYNFRSLAGESSNQDGPADESQRLDSGSSTNGGGPNDQSLAGDRAHQRPGAEETLILVEADGVQRAPFRFPKGGLQLFLSCLESGLRPDRYLDPAIKFDGGGGSTSSSSLLWDPLHSPTLPLAPLTGDSLASPGHHQQGRWLFSSSKNQSGSLGLDSPSAGSETSQGSGRFDSFLKRLPSLKRRTQSDSQPPTRAAPDHEAITTDGRMITLNQGGNEPRDSHPPSSPSTMMMMTDNYVYRIVSMQQPDWPLLMPPHSALSVGGESSSVSSSSANCQQPTNDNTNNNQKFRWSLSRLAKFSARYTDSGSTSSSISMGTTNGCGGTLNYSAGGSLSSLSQPSSTQRATIEGNNHDQSVLNDTPDTLEEDDGQHQEGSRRARDSSKELARIEAKLDDLKKSASNEILALRTQSVQTLCESMRKQILARAFYGWLAHCRKVRIIRAHLVKLIKLVEGEEIDDPEEAVGHLQSGLTQSRWQEYKRNERKLDEKQVAREVNQLVYYGGVESNELRQEVWPYLLGHYRFTDGEAKRLAKDKWARECYDSLGREWIKIERVVKQRDNELLAANMAKASRMAATKDEFQTTTTKGGASSGRSISETSDDKMISGGGVSAPNGMAADSNINNNDNGDDNNQDIQSDIPENESSCGLVSTITATNDNKMDEIDGNKQVNGGELKDETQMIDTNENQKNIRATKTRGKENVSSKKGQRRRRRYRLESTGSVGSDASITDQYGNNIHRIDKDVQRCDRNFWYFKDTKNLDKLRNIMCTYVWQHLDIGYVQGMCDLAAPFLVIFDDDELMAYNCFSLLMKRMEANFPHGNAMDQHFESLKHLIQILDPKLFDVLQSNGDYTHFYFCYRWLLLDFKRELSYEDVYKVWETIWSARVVVTDNFVVFMALAMVRYYRDIIIENNMDFTDTIKFFNEMAEHHDARGIMALARDCIVELKSLITDMES